MQQFNKYFAIFVALLFWVFGVYLLVSPSFETIAKEMRVIFAIFLFLYGAFRLARAFFRRND